MTLKELQVQNAALLAKIAELQNTIVINDAADEINNAQSIALAAHEYSQIADFVRDVKHMRFGQKYGSTTPLTEELTNKVDEAIEKDVFFIQLLKHY